MFILFHVFVPFTIFIGARLDAKLRLNRLSFLIALILPDIVDKALMWTIGSTGRDIAHSLLFAGLVAIPFLVAKKYAIARSLCLGCLIHIILDWPYVPWLFPFVPYDWGWSATQYAGFWDHFFRSLLQLVVIVTELCAIGCALWLITSYHLTKRKELRDFFRDVTTWGVPSKPQGALLNGN